MNSLPSTESVTYRRWLFGICFLSGLFGGLASALAPSYLPSITTGLSTAEAEKAGAFINASFIYGMLLGGIALGFYSDRRGRKAGLSVATGCTAVFLLLSAFAPNWQWLVAFRFLNGFGVGAVLLITAVFIAEAWPVAQKAVALGILSVSFPMGIFSAGLITYNILQWRQAFWVGLLPLMLTVVAWFALKESPEWTSKPPLKDVAINEFTTDGLAANIIKGSLIYGSMLIGLWAVFAWLPSWVQSLVRGDGQKERGLSLMIFAAGGITGGIASGWVVNRIGLKAAMLLCFGGSFLISLLLFKFTVALTAVSFLGMGLMALLFGVSQGVLNAYIPCLFPAARRSTATGICFNISRVFTATVVFFVGWLVTALGGYGNALFYFSWVFLIGGVVMLFTKTPRHGTY